MKLEISEGDAAWRLVEAPAFVAEWSALAREDPKLTLLQEPEFVVPWYRAYREVHAPLLVTARAPGGDLLGLLPLARPRGAAAPVHAGAEQAEYHGWIARPGQDAEFILRALVELRRAIGFRSWRWRWLPPGSGHEWTSSPELARAGIHALRELRGAPLWDLGDPEKLAKVSASRSLRSKINRFRRRGDYRLERVGDVERLRALLPTLARQCDFRQAAVHGVRPFADDPCKARFLVERQAYPRANHVSVLLCGEEPLSFHVGACDGRTCLLGLSAHSPPESRNSPGTLHLFELARRLTEEGYRELDLTPGTDAYKLRFANRERELCRVTLHATRIDRWRSSLLLRARAALVHAAGSLPAASPAADLAAPERLQRWQRDLRRAGRDLARLELRGLARRARAGLLRARSYACFVRPGSAAPPAPEAGRVRLQAYEDLLGAEPGAGHAQREGLVDSQARFADGETLYTVLLAGRLAAIGWRARTAEGSAASALERAGLLREGWELLWGERPARGEDADAALRDCVARMLADGEAAGARGAVLCLAALDAGARAELGRLGFAEEGRLVERRAFGRRPSWRHAGGPGNRARAERAGP